MIIKININDVELIEHFGRRKALYNLKKNVQWANYACVQISDA